MWEISDCEYLPTNNSPKQTMTDSSSTDTYAAMDDLSYMSETETGIEDTSRASPEVREYDRVQYPTTQPSSALSWTHGGKLHRRKSQPRQVLHATSALKHSSEGHPQPSQIAGFSSVDIENVSRPTHTSTTASMTIRSGPTDLAATSLLDLASAGDPPPSPGDSLTSVEMLNFSGPIRTSTPTSLVPISPNPDQIAAKSTSDHDSEGSLHPLTVDSFTAVEMLNISGPTRSPSPTALVARPDPVRTPFLINLAPSAAPAVFRPMPVHPASPLDLSKFGAYEKVEPRHSYGDRSAGPSKKKSAPMPTPPPASSPLGLPPTPSSVASVPNPLYLDLDCAETTSTSQRIKTKGGQSTKAKKPKSLRISGKSGGGSPKTRKPKTKTPGSSVKRASAVPQIPLPEHPRGSLPPIPSLQKLSAPPPIPPITGGMLPRVPIKCHALTAYGLHPQPSRDHGHVDAVDIFSPYAYTLGPYEEATIHADLVITPPPGIFGSLWRHSGSDMPTCISVVGTKVPPGNTKPLRVVVRNESANSVLIKRFHLLAKMVFNQGVMPILYYTCCNTGGRRK